MLTFFFLCLIYIITMKFMRKYAGRQEPFWGVGFAMLGIVIEIILIFIISIIFVIYSSSTNPSQAEELGIQVLSIFLAIPIVLGISYTTSRSIQKKNIRNTAKTPRINYKWATILSIIFGIFILFLVMGLTGKFDGWIFAIINIIAVQGFVFHKRSLAIPPLPIDELKNQPYVLFLRDFKADSVLAFQKKRNFLFRKKVMTIEQFLRKFIPKEIPFVALGNPEDYLPTLGCQKAYLSDESWQEQIKEYIDNASLILVLEGTSQGLQWELEYIFQNTAPNKVKLITWSEDFTSNKSFKKQFGEDYTDNELFNKIGFDIDKTESGQLISFNEQWKAVKYENYDSLPLYVNQI